MKRFSRGQNLEKVFPDYLERIIADLCNVGFFERSVLVGSWAMFCYAGTLGAQWNLRTGDVDLAVQVIASGKKSKIDLKKILENAGATPVFSSLDGLMRFLIRDYRIEFIAHDSTRSRKKESKLIDIRDLNISAIPLPFIQMLLDFSEKVDFGDFFVKIPIPEAFFLHKLIIAQRRPGEDKRNKDLEQCETLIPFLELEKLQQVVDKETIGKDTKKRILLSCNAIGFDFERLGFRR